MLEKSPEVCELVGKRQCKINHAVTNVSTRICTSFNDIENTLKHHLHKQFWL